VPRPPAQAFALPPGSLRADTHLPAAMLVAAQFEVGRGWHV
jgi:hypothetical protein